MSVFGIHVTPLIVELDIATEPLVVEGEVGSRRHAIVLTPPVLCGQTVGVELADLILGCHARVPPSHAWIWISAKTNVSLALLGMFFYEGSIRGKGLEDRQLSDDLVLAGIGTRSKQEFSTDESEAKEAYGHDSN